jgi:ribose 5-phosphate isomerase RpiB
MECKKHFFKFKKFIYNELKDNKIEVIEHKQCVYCKLDKYIKYEQDVDFDLTEEHPKKINSIGDL